MLRIMVFLFIINESFAKELNLENPVGVAAGHSWYEDDTLGTIIGVVEDFNFNSLHYKINTLALVVHPDWGYSELSVKIDGENIPAAIAAVEKTWNELIPSWPFDYSFLDEHFEELYRSDQQMKSVITLMAILAIFIACMGLFGLAAITTERKIKEIGIRKNTWSFCGSDYVSTFQKLCAVDCAGIYNFQSAYPDIYAPMAGEFCVSD